MLNSTTVWIMFLLCSFALSCGCSAHTRLVRRWRPRSCYEMRPLRPHLRSRRSDSSLYVSFPASPHCFLTFCPDIGFLLHFPRPHLVQITSHCVTCTIISFLAYILISSYLALDRFITPLSRFFPIYFSHYLRIARSHESLQRLLLLSCIRS